MQHSLTAAKRDVVSILQQFFVKVTEDKRPKAKNKCEIEMIATLKV